MIQVSKKNGVPMFLCSLIFASITACGDADLADASSVAAGDTTASTSAVDTKSAAADGAGTGTSTSSRVPVSTLTKTAANSGTTSRQVRSTTTAPTTPTTSTPTTSSAPPAPAPAPATAVSNASVTAPSFLTAAITDMRTTANTFAANDARLLQRGQFSYSSQIDRAVLVMGRYATSAAFTNQNPDYGPELSWVSPGAIQRTIPTWPRILLWNQLYLSESPGANHAPGYQGNSRVKVWDHQLWIRSRSTGAWTRRVMTNAMEGEAWRPHFREYGGNTANINRRVESDGSTSVGLVPRVGLDGSGSYWIWHGYAGGIISIDPNDIGDVLVVAKTALVLDSANGPDDRDSARFLFALGADYYPPSGYTTEFLPSVGTSRHKFVTAKFPSFQYHVMHTMSYDEIRTNPPPVAQ